MGYSAAGNGAINLKVDADLNKIREIIEQTEKESGIEFDLDWCRETGDPCLRVWESKTHWHEEDVLGFLEKTIPFTKDGSIEYSGEDDSYWRYRFDKEAGKWIDEPGSLEYDCSSKTDEELIAELEKRGYVISKKEAE